MELRNLTPFPMQAWDSFTPERYAIGTLLVRSKHTLVQKGDHWHLLPMPEQGSLFGADQFHGEAGQSSIRYSSDYVPHKPGTDILLNACAYAPEGKATSQWQSAVSIGDHHHELAIFGKRHWYRKSGWWLTDPEPCTQVPIRYENAFGGAVIEGDDPTQTDVTQPPENTPNYLAFEPRNPIGCGLLHKKMSAKHVMAPQIENPHDLINVIDPYKQPQPIGLGAIGRSWQPRQALAGRYDDKWLATRHPYLPKDFNPSHYQDAHPNLILPNKLRGNETLVLSHLCPEQAQATIVLPELKLMWLLENSQGDKLYHRFEIDTLLLDIEQGLSTGHVYLSWRTQWPIQANNKRLTVKLIGA